MRNISYPALGACLFLMIYTYLWLGFSTVEQESSMTFDTELVLDQDSAKRYNNRSGYNCTRPNFTKIDLSPYHLPIEVHEDKFTVVILTHNRTAVMLQTAKHYSRMGKVDKIVILWNNQGVPPPPIQEILQTKVPIVIKIMPENKLRLRYQPIDDLQTQALFNVDDDMLVAEQDMNRAFEVWKLNPYTAVGFFARAFTQPLFGWSKYKYVMSKLDGAFYSILLVDVAFIHREYFRLFSDTLPEGMASLVDKFNNCEDIAMSFLLSNLCQCASGLHIQPRYEIQHVTGKVGLSGSSYHGYERGICISTYARFFKEMPLKEINCVYD